MASPAPRLRRN